MQVKQILLAGTMVVCITVLILLSLDQPNGNAKQHVDADIDTTSTTAHAVAPPVQNDEQPSPLYRTAPTATKPILSDGTENLPATQEASKQISATFEVWLNENNIIPREQFLVRSAIEDARLNWLNARHDASRSIMYETLTEEEFEHIMSGEDAKKELKEELLEIVGPIAVEALEDIGFDLLIAVPLK